FIIAPATANTINKLSQGLADNLLTQTALAYSKVKLIAPAANTAMIQNPITQTSIASLKNANFQFINTQSKELACRTEGDGALADPLELFFQVARMCLKESFWEGRHAFVTGGGTIEAIDDVRYLSNYSSGKMAKSLALALFLKGAMVDLITTKDGSELPHDVQRDSVKSAQQMHESLVKVVSEKSKGSQKEAFLFMAAAVGDYKPSSPTQGKLKKDQLGQTWSLELEKNIDILESIDKSSLKAIGFKAEMDASNATKNAQKMLKNKTLDAVALNILTDSSSFGTEDNAFDLITKEGTVSIERSDKLTLAFNLLKHVQTL
ncbi:MAG: bifunctional phosphopantothenoylcysteine decarboxylase/phosphopantothenate--cysteine ligase CoaBC, partial [Thiovulaceae bacterium]|nr:bifunctional phosphopantothenoylcysteine decarboxylase/phosphopantothenate--cysteine ligase CoaBC [Sulfurimonadaceae bacterium]